jgi:Tfp pilus assembly protein PilZ
MTVGEHDGRLGRDRRRFPRRIPRSTLTVALETGEGPGGEGVVANISGGGACVCTEAAFTVGDSLVLRIRFTDEPLPISATGRVVWSGEGDGQPRCYGLQWTHSGLQVDRLEYLISRHCDDERDPGTGA